MRKQATASGRMRPQMGRRTYAKDHIYFDDFRRNFETCHFFMRDRTKNKYRPALVDELFVCKMLQGNEK